MPPNRFEEKYLIQLVALDKYSELLVQYIRGKKEKIEFWKHLLRVLLINVPWVLEPKTLLLSHRERRFRFAERRASLAAMIEIYNLQQNNSSSHDLHTV